jgi:hypothetical protein
MFITHLKPLQPKTSVCNIYNCVVFRVIKDGTLCFKCKTLCVVLENNISIHMHMDIGVWEGRETTMFIMHLKPYKSKMHHHTLMMCFGKLTRA